jgi:hypothetical protein
MAATTKKTTGKTGQTGKEKPKKLSKAGEWMRNHPKGDMIVNDPRVLNGMTLLEMYN